jgi:hypothetical protein
VCDSLHGCAGIEEAKGIFGVHVRPSADIAEALNEEVDKNFDFDTIFVGMLFAPILNFI